MDPFYNFGIHAYRFGVSLATIRNRKARMLLKGQAGLFKRLRSKLDDKGGVKIENLTFQYNPEENSKKVLNNFSYSFT